MPSRLLIVVLLLLLPGCSTTPRVHSKAEIESVFAQRDELKAKFLTVGNTRGKRKPDYIDYALEVKKIDVRRCPAGFQQPWYDYLIALEQAHVHDNDSDWERLGRVVSTAAVATASSGAALVTLPGLVTPTKKEGLRKELLQRLEDAWFQVDRACIYYGVKAAR